MPFRPTLPQIIEKVRHRVCKFNGVCYNIMNAQSILVDRRQPVTAEKGTTLSDHEESGLIARAKRGDEAAIGQLYRQHAPGIYGYIASRVGDPALADDLTSEAFLRALEGLPQFEYRGISISAWLYRIAHDRMADHFRRQARRPTAPLEDDLLATQDGFDQALDTRLRLEQVNEAIERLTPQQHQVILLRFVAGLKLQEVAYVMAKSTAAIKMLQLRALTRLKQLVAQTG
jgi:RNA polymerase sigma-70 factor (ECF subfamily)